MHKCPQETCTIDVEDDKLACSRHWFQLPEVLRRAIWRAFNRQDWKTHRALLMEARRWWEEH